MILVHLNHKEIILYWIPSHVDIEGNEKADLCAKRALAKGITYYTCRYTDFKPLPMILYPIVGNYDGTNAKGTNSIISFQI